MKNKIVFWVENKPNQTFSYIYAGMKKAFERLDYHLSCDMWNYRKEDYENHGIRIV